MILKTISDCNFIQFHNRIMSRNSVSAFYIGAVQDFTKSDVFGVDFYCLWPTPRANPVKKMKYYTPLGQKQSFCESASHDRAIMALKFPLFYPSLLGRLMPSLCALFLLVRGATAGPHNAGRLISRQT